MSLSLTPHKERKKEKSKEYCPSRNPISANNCYANCVYHNIMSVLAAFIDVAATMCAEHNITIEILLFK